MDLLRKDEDFFSFCEALHEERDVDHSSNSFFFLFWKEVFSFQMPFVHKNFFFLAFISKIYINIMTCYLVAEYLSKKQYHHFCCILFISFQNVRDFYYIMYYVCKHLADVLLKILLHKIDTCICTASSRAWHKS